MRDDVLNFARLLLTQCDGAFSRDEKGYDIFDAFTVRQILNPDIFDISELADEEVEYLRQKLLRYKKQIRKVATEFGVPKDKVETGLEKLDEPVAECSVLIRGQVKKARGRISLKWLRQFFLGETNIQEIEVLNMRGSDLDKIFQYKKGEVA